MTSLREGGCLCGAVRYRVAWPPLATATCSCRNCQKQAGSAFSVVLVFPRDALATDGTLHTYRDRGSSGQTVERRFCPNCGSPVITDTPRARIEGVIFVKGGTLDQIADLAPTTHYWNDSAQPWVHLPEDCVRLARE